MSDHSTIGSAFSRLSALAVLGGAAVALLVANGLPPRPSGLP
jgi:hypothetical protein